MHFLEDRILRPISTRVLENGFDKNRKKIKIFARTACVGDDLLARSFRKSRVTIQKYQKLRMDQFAAFLEEDNFESSYEEYVRFAKSTLLIPDLASRWLGEFFVRDPRTLLLESDFMILDSFCELTDRKWSIQDKLNIYCAKSDIGDFANGGDLIGTDDFERSLVKILDFSHGQRKSLPIIWLHYSAKNDSREKYRTRSCDLLEVALEKSKYFDDFHVLRLSDEKYEFAERDSMPYHYGKATMINLKVELTRILAPYSIYGSRYTYNFD